MIEKRTRRLDITGAVLAGGKSTRMHREKALLTLEGETFLARVIRTLQGIFESVVVVVDHPGRFPSLDVPICVDTFRNCGPLGGIHAALAYAKTSAVFVASCDTPLITRAVISSLIKNPLQGDAVVASTYGYLQPLCACYARSCLPVLESHLKEGNYSVNEFLRSVRTVTIAIDEHADALKNINTPDDYRSLIRVVP
jgi:molybdopterin-guanine dinucleotide biosynthesis protein A